MHLEVSRLWLLARNIERVAYREREMRPAGKKHRPIDPMYAWSKRLFRKLHRWLQIGNFAHSRAHGGIRGRSCFSSAQQHLGCRYFWSRDIKDCYPSVVPELFRRAMLELGFPPDTAELLSLLCTVRNSVPQGSPLSNDALNLFMWAIDQAIASFCGRHGLNYSRVADDFVISGNDREAGAVATRLIERLLAERGLKINRQKCRKVGFRRQSEKPLVHNIAVHNRRGTTISDEHRESSLAAADRYVAACKSLSVDSLQAVAAKRQSVVGWMHYCRQAQFGPARAIRNKIDAGDAAVRKKLKSLGFSAHESKWWLVSKKRNEPRRLAALWRRRLAPAKPLKVFRDELARPV